MARLKHHPGIVSWAASNKHWKSAPVNDGIRVPSSLSLSHKRSRVNSNMPGHVCQTVKHKDQHTSSGNDKCSSHHSTLLPGMRNLKGNVCSPCFRVPVWDTESADYIRQWEHLTITLLFLRLGSACTVHNGPFTTTVFTLQLFSIFLNYVSFSTMYRF